MSLLLNGDLENGLLLAEHPKVVCNKIGHLENREQ